MIGVVRTGSRVCNVCSITPITQESAHAYPHQDPRCYLPVHAGVRRDAFLKGQDITWDEASLNEWLQGPGKFVKGTKMIYSVPDEKDRQDVIAYLKTLK